MSIPTKEELLPRRLDSWIEGYLDYTKEIKSPLIFKKWAAISCISAALERKV